MSQFMKDFGRCKGGDHELIELLRSPGMDTDEVARWCRVCGAVVVDREYDGRLAGRSVKMMGPKIYKYVNNL